MKEVGKWGLRLTHKLINKGERVTRDYAVGENAYAVHQRQTSQDVIIKVKMQRLLSIFPIYSASVCVLNKNYPVPRSLAKKMYKLMRNVVLKKERELKERYKKEKDNKDKAALEKVKKILE